MCLWLVWRGIDLTTGSGYQCLQQLIHPPASAYGGYLWNGLIGEPRLHVKRTAKIMYGYVGEHKDKVPLNHGGWAPMVVPAVGYRIGPRHAFQISVLGSAELLFTYHISLLQGQWPLRLNFLLHESPPVSSFSWQPPVETAEQPWYPVWVEV